MDAVHQPAAGQYSHFSLGLTDGRAGRLAPYRLLARPGIAFSDYRSRLQFFEAGAKTDTALFRPYIYYQRRFTYRRWDTDLAEQAGLAELDLVFTLLPGGILQT